MAYEQFGEETRVLFEAADRAIARARQLVQERADMISASNFYLNRRALLSHSARERFLHTLYRSNGLMK
jgi:hypothetical protein